MPEGFRSMARWIRIGRRSFDFSKAIDILDRSGECAGVSIFLAAQRTIKLDGDDAASFLEFLARETVEVIPPRRPTISGEDLGGPRQSAQEPQETRLARIQREGG